MKAEETLRPLTYEQEGLWFLGGLTPGNPVYNRPCFLKFTGPLDHDILRKCLQQIIQRHEILRARISVMDGLPYLIISPCSDPGLQFTDLSALPPTARDAELEKTLSAAARRPFLLEGGSLFHLGLVRITPTEHFLAAVFHHIVFDGWSAQVFLRELSLFYAAHVSGQKPSLPEIASNYCDYALQQRSALAGETLERHLSYWRKAFKSEALSLPLDRQRPTVPSYEGGTCSFILGPELTATIKKVCRSEKVTLFMFLLAVYQVLLHRCANQSGITIGCLLSGRTRPETEKLIGLFINTLPISTVIGEDTSFREVLAAARQAALGCFTHQEIPLSRLIAELSLPRNSDIPLFQALFNMHNMPRMVTDIPGLVIEELTDYDYGVSLSDIALKAYEKDGAVFCSINYDSALFDPETVCRLTRHFQVLAASAADNPDEKVAALPLLTPDERLSLLALSAGTGSSVRQPKAAHRYFEEHAALGPERTALLADDYEISYDALNRRANRLARHLKANGLGPGGLAAICLDEPVETMVAFLAVLKAGGAYLPLDLSYPAERLRLMLSDSQASYILVTRHTAKLADGLNIAVICPEAEAGQIAARHASNLTEDGGPSSLCYVMYTSGSTGRPKGVAIEHKGIVRLVKDIDYALLDPSQVFLQLTSIAFDVSGFEIYGALLNGGSLVLLPDGKASLVAVADTIKRRKVNSLCATPEQLQALLSVGRNKLSGLKQIFSAGDKLPVSLALRLKAVLPECALINAYGPTENSVYSTAYTVREISPFARSVPIGRPIASDRCYILDKRLEPVPLGLAGDLYVAGDGVARGYLHNEKLTAEKFLPDPYSSVPGAKLYKTGDLARFLQSGDIEFIGRADDQLKIRSCRIEPGEIEAVLSLHPSVGHSIVTAIPDQDGFNSLAAYIVPAANFQVEPQELRAFLRRKLPEYMQPSFIIEIAEVPLTPSGKLDKAALPQPKQAAANKRGPVLPRTPTEQKLAKIWRQLLNLPVTGVTDNFFALGGHSLLAMIMFAHIEKTFGKKFAASLLLQEDTIEKLARLIDSNQPSMPPSHLVAIQPKGSKAPLYCVHALEGEIVPYRNLALELGPDQPLYGLQLGTAANLSAVSVTGLAERYTAELRKFQPRGPYYLAGHSFGGVIAFEIARQLSLSGEKVAMLAIFDTKNPQTNQLPSLLQPSPKLGFLPRLKRSIIFFLDSGMRNPGAYLWSRAEAEWSRFRRRVRRWQNKDEHFDTSGLEAVQNALYQAYLNYRPERYPGKLTLFRAKKRKNIYSSESDDLGWREAADETVIYEVPGDHARMIAKENLPVLVKYLKECIHEASRD